MIVLYLIPELMRRKKIKKYEYPKIPDISRPYDKPQNHTQQSEQNQSLERIPKVEQTSYQTNQGVEKHYGFLTKNYPKVGEEKLVVTPYTSNIIDNGETAEMLLNRATVLNGIIWTEILLPPRAYRSSRFKLK